MITVRPYGKYSMVDIDAVGGVQMIVRELLEAGLLNGDVIVSVTGETLSEQVKRLGAKKADGRVVYAVEKPYKPTGGLRVLGGNLSPILGHPEVGGCRGWSRQQSLPWQGPGVRG